MTNNHIEEGRFNPDWAVPVGEIIEEWLDANNLKKNTFADLIGKSPKWMSEFIAGIAPLTVETAIDMEEHCPFNAKHLMKMEINYSIFKARKKRLKNE